MSPQAALHDLTSTEDPGSCIDCHAPFEPVRPGKAQPTCTCADKCPCCGTMRAYYNKGDISERRSGFLCPNCDSDDPN